MSETALAAAESSPAATERGPWSVASLAGFACGIFLIVPFIAGIAAIGLGIGGLRETREPVVRGRRLAVAAIVLGIVNIVGWGGYGKLVSSLSGPGRAVAHRFLADLGAGNIAEAGRECVGHINETRLEAGASQIKNWGGIKSVAVLYINNDTVNGDTTGSVRGLIRTPGGEHSFRLQTVARDGVWRVSEFLLW